MTISEIRNTLSDILRTEGKLELTMDKETIVSDSIKDLLVLLPENMLTINNPQLETSTDVVTITGETDFINLTQLNTTVIFYLVTSGGTSTLELNITLELPVSNWKLSNAFPYLANLELDDLLFNQSKLFLTSVKTTNAEIGQELAAGIYFYGNLQINSPMTSQVDWLWLGETEIPVLGNLNFLIPETLQGQSPEALELLRIPDFQLRSTASETDIQIGTVQLNTAILIGFTKIFPATDASQTVPRVQIDIHVNGEFAFQTHDNVAVRIPLNAALYSPEQTSLLLRLQPPKDENLVHGDLKGLASFFDHQDLDGFDLSTFLPEELSINGEIAFNFLFVELSLQRKKIEQLGIGILFKELSWEIIPPIAQGSSPLCVLEDIGVDVIFLNPMAPKATGISVDLSTRLKFAGNIDMVGKINLPSYELQGYLYDGDIISFEPFLDLISGNFFSNPDTSPPYIYDLRLSAFPKAKQLRLSAQIEGQLQFNIGDVDFGFGINSINISYGDGISGSIGGYISIGNNIILSTNYESDTSIWQFVGEVGAIPIDDLIQDIKQKLNANIDIQKPTSLEGFIIQNLALSFNTQSKDFTFTCEGSIPINGENLDLTLHIDLRNQPDGSYTQQFSGIVKIDGLEFDLALERDREVGAATSSSLMVADFYSEEGVTIVAKTLFEKYVSGVSIPDSLKFTLHDALLAIQKTGTGENSSITILFALDLGTGIDLGRLPLVGNKISGAKDAKFSYRVLIASDAFDSDSVQKINTLLPSGIGALPTESQSGATPVASGLKLIASVQLGGEAIEITAGGNNGGSATTPVALDANPDSSVPVQDNSNGDDSIKWVSIQKTFTPVTFERVGVQYKNNILWILLDSLLSVGPLTLSLDGLGAGSPLDRFDPHFRLSGIGIDYKSGPVEIGGALIKEPNPPANVAFAFDGSAVIKMEVLSLEALGSYAQLKSGEPSMALYAMLDYPLGGPSFFFVTGLAAGFGYNRALTVPEIADLDTYPLIQVAKGQAALTDLAESFATYVPIEIGQYFLALGLKFTSFKQIDAFALLTVNFGQHFEIDIIGNAYTQIPTKVPGSNTPPLAVIDMDFKVSFIPADGLLSVEAQLTSQSHILDKNCILQGGFAFYAWFAGVHQDDFVASLGGYHPQFKVPAHYPKVPRLGFHWQVSDELSLKGGFYFALTAHAFMAGGLLKASYVSGHLEAHFKAGADFLITWQPYHYDAKLYLEIGGSYTLGSGILSTTISIDLSANVHLWGPKFSGTAEIDLWVTTVTVSFGDQQPVPPPPISWTTFKSSFLPADDAICSIAVQHGLLKNVERGSDTIWIINPKEFSMVTNSVIPAQKSIQGTTETEYHHFGIESMGLTQADITTALQTVTITRDGDSVENEFDFNAILKDMPSGLWGEAAVSGQAPVAKVNGSSFAKDLFAGFEIKPKHPPTVGVTHDADLSEFQYHEPDIKADAFSTPVIDRIEFDDTQDLNDLISNPGDSVHTAHSDLLDGLRDFGFDEVIDQLPYDLGNDFVLDPLIVAAA